MLKRSKRPWVLAAAVGAVAMSLTSAAPAALTYTFDTPAGDNGLDPQGWTSTRGGPSVPVQGGRGASVGGGGGPGQEDGPHPNLVFSSPAFLLDPVGDLTFQLHGGEGQGDQPTTVFYPNLASIPVAESTTSGGSQHVGLRRVSDGAYVLNSQKTAEGNSWETLTFTQAQLAPFVLPGVAYQLDLIETRHGGWGHTEIDDVSIPGTLAPIPEPASAGLLALGALAALRRKR